jgi:tRNA modification GTPase
MYTQDQSIIAQCTPTGSGALAVVRLSGESAFTIADQLSKLKNTQKISTVASHTIHLGLIIDAAGKEVDQAMIAVMHAPKTFTGQNTVEITCHNNPFIIAQIIELALAHGARLAQPGEFTQRAVLNNKMDMVQAEALNELIHANTQLALKKSLTQLGGTLSKWIATLEESLLKALALSDASFEFIDDEIEFGDQIYLLVNNVIEELQNIKKSFNQQRHIREGIRIALLGSVNAGKSSLFNALLNSNKAIVTPIAGTTRDVLEAGIYCNNSYRTLIDTAGLRQTNDIIEYEGIKRSYEQAEKADIILLIVDGSRLLTPEEETVYATLAQQWNHKIIVVTTKADLGPHTSSLVTLEHQVIVSSKTKHNFDRLEALLEEKIQQLFSTISCPFLLNQRQGILLLGLEKKLIIVQSMLAGPISYELISYELKKAIEYLSELTGKTVTEKGMDTIFREFCIGK